MQTALIALIPLMHIALTVVFIVAAFAKMKTNPAFSGLLALIAAFCAWMTVIFFASVLRGA